MGMNNTGGKSDMGNIARISNSFGAIALMMVFKIQDI
jgi:hypothetical protein